MWNLKAIIPSVLSTIRLALSFVLPFSPEEVWAWLVVCAGVSDVADGWLARRWQVESWQGGLLDAVADKLFVLVVVSVFAITGKFSPMWIPLLLARDFVVAVTSLYIFSCGMRQSHKQLAVRVSGKLATGGQFLLFLVVLLYPAGGGVALVFASLCSLWAGFEYGRVFYRFVGQQLSRK